MQMKGRARPRGRRAAPPAAAGNWKAPGPFFDWSGPAGRSCLASRSRRELQRGGHPVRGRPAGRRPSRPSMGNHSGRPEDPEAGAVTTTKRTGIPAPRELSVTVSRERTVPRGPSNPKKSVSSPTSSSTPTPTKHLRTTSTRPKQENESGEKAVLESQVRELLAEAKAKDSEINRLRSELKKFKEKRTLNAEGTNALDPNVDGTSVSPGDSEPLIRALEEKNKNFQKELADLEEENRALKEKLTYFEHSPNSEAGASQTGDSSCPTSVTQDSSFGSPTGDQLSGEIDEYKKNIHENALRTSGSSSSDVTKASLSPDASDFEHITADTPSRPLSSTSNPFKSSKCSTTGSSPNNVSELSLASLTEKIQKMEENHHSTAEELQATLQELSDQQQMVQELTAENEKLVDEKTVLETSFHQHRERAEQLSQENEKLMNLLQERVKNEEPSAQEGKILELEQKCAEILEQGRFEREKLLNIQQQLTCSLRKAEEENQGALEMIKHLKEENEKLNGLLELERRNNSVMAKTLEEYKVTFEGLKMENGSLKAHLENEKQKAAETSLVGQTAEGCEVQEMLKVARAEKDQLERSCTELKQELLKAHGEVKHVSSLLAKVEKDYSYLKELCDHQAEQLSRTSLKLQEKASESDAEIKDMKETIFELEDQVEQHRAVKLHNNQLISELESNVMKLEEQKSDLERQLKTLTKQIKEETEEWRRFQADLQTAVVVANDIKCEAQQELRTVKRKLLEEEEKNARLQKELGDMQGHSSSNVAQPLTECSVAVVERTVEGGGVAPRGTKLHGPCQLAERLVEERQPSPCHDGKLQPFLYERGSNVEEQSPLTESRTVSWWHPLFHRVIAVKSLYLFSTCWNQLIAQSKMSPPSVFLSFSQKIQQSFIWSIR
ncbi:cytospin-B isoform X9 [Equus przewalskii]|uniref:Cytospin-B isoform X9 n=1 Tax=Equus przewalskii TaxID=9798 RepID=A0ABM4JUP1_EQUPR